MLTQLLRLRQQINQSKLLVLFFISLTLKLFDLFVKIISFSHFFMDFISLELLLYVIRLSLTNNW